MYLNLWRSSYEDWLNGLGFLAEWFSRSVLAVLQQKLELVFMGVTFVDSINKHAVIYSKITLYWDEFRVW